MKSRRVRTALLNGCNGRPNHKGQCCFGSRCSTPGAYVLIVFTPVIQSGANMSDQKIERGMSILKAVLKLELPRFVARQSLFEYLRIA